MFQKLFMTLSLLTTIISPASALSEQTILSQHSEAETVQLARSTETVCKITDPTGTPLNVRSQPNGKVINTLKNGRDVYIEEVTYDRQGRPWAKVSGYYNGKYKLWGWVFREFISCYNR